MHPTTDVVQPISRNFRKLILKGPLRRSVVFLLLMIPILLEKWYLIIFYCTTETTFLFCFYWFDLLFSFSQSGHIVFWFNLKKAWQQLVLSYVCWTNIILFWVAFLLIISTGFFFNPWSANPTKWSDTLKQIVGYCRQIVWVC